MVLARTVLLLGAGALASVAVACSAAPDTSKTSLPVCNVDDPGCPRVTTHAPNKEHSDIPSDPVHVPEPPPPSAVQPAAADAGHDAAPVGPGKFCTELGACCKQLGEAGYVTTTCMSVLSTNNEDACYTQHASYKSSGDCT